MPWKEVSVMSLRWEFVELANQSNVNFSQLCRRFGISRDKGYKWWRRYRAEADWPVWRIAAVSPTSRRTDRRRWNSGLSVCGIAHPAWGAWKIQAPLEGLGSGRGSGSEYGSPDFAAAGTH